MNEIEGVRKVFLHFNTKVNKLNRLSFSKNIFNTTNGITIGTKLNANGRYVEIAERRGPNEEAIDAFVLTFRLFIQENDKASLMKLAKLYQEPFIDDDLRRQFEYAKDWWFGTYLESQTSLNIIYNGKPLLNRNVMQVFVYGGLAHANSKLQEHFDSWCGTPMIGKMMEMAFVEVLSNFLSVANHIKEINNEVIKQITPLSPVLLAITRRFA